MEWIHKYLMNFFGAYIRKKKETQGKESTNLDSSLDSHFLAVRPWPNPSTALSLDFFPLCHIRMIADFSLPVFFFSLLM